MRKPLQEMRVLDFSTNVAGPTCTAALADFGATVIKVERPGKGDDNRSFPPMLDGKGSIHFWVNRGKKSITLNTNTPEGTEIARKLIMDADVIVESYRPGIMKKFGLDYEAVARIKPEIIYCSISAYGNSGPYAKKPGYDLIAQAVSGLMDLNGEEAGPPYKSGLTIGDYWNGLNAYTAIVTAWYHFLKTHEGQYIDASLVQNLVNHNQAVLSSNIGEYPKRTGNHHPDYAPYGLFSKGRDENIVISVDNEEDWDKLCKVMGMESIQREERFKDNQSRVANREELTRIIEEKIAQVPDLKQFSERLQAASIPCCKVSTMKDVVEDAHILSNKWIHKLELPDDLPGKEGFLTRNVSVSLSKTPGESGKSPVLGADNYDVLSTIGMGREEVDALMESWVKK